MTSYAVASCPSCGWEALLAPADVATLRGCRLCAGPVRFGESPLPWHHGLLSKH